MAGVGFPRTEPLYWTRTRFMHGFKSVQSHLSFPPGAFSSQPEVIWSTENSKGTGVFDNSTVDSLCAKNCAHAKMSVKYPHELLTWFLCMWPGAIILPWLLSIFLPLYFIGLFIDSFGHNGYGKVVRLFALIGVSWTLFSQWHEIG